MRSKDVRVIFTSVYLKTIKTEEPSQVNCPFLLTNDGVERGWTLLTALNKIHFHEEPVTKSKSYLFLIVFLFSIFRGRFTPIERSMKPNLQEEGSIK
ncbi:hypothetical protein AVEN_65160-1 [Araneus ventricosus]|uniref:Uncharacterized protein n=1 Tax=Araneus ventricosus TaxID=182803 RepID=A0A4Y2AFJ6_ARAVE|nr:hypothetical protein AVEN_65160-1 [Araneus ventricosus]